MEDQTIQEVAGSLSTVIEKIQQTIEDLFKVTNDLKLRVDDQQQKLDQFSARSDEVYEQIMRFTEANAQKLHEMDGSFLALTAKQDESTQQIHDWIDELKGTLESMNKAVSDLEAEYQALAHSSMENVKGYSEQIEISNTKLKSASEQLILSLERQLAEVDNKVSLKLDSAAEIMSVRLDPTLNGLTQALAATKKQLRWTGIAMAVIALLAIIAFVWATVTVS